jgi:enoyl-CoA hydratase/carnithine racemase
MPTLALINGHAFAGGIMLAMAHDYRLGPGSHGWICVNELQFDAPLMRPFTALFRQQIPLLHYRSVALEARRFTGEEAMEVSLVDGVAHSFDDAIKFIEDRDLVAKAQSRSYAQIKTEMYADLLAELTPKAVDAATRKTAEEYSLATEKEEKGRAWYERWAEENKPKSKI